MSKTPTPTEILLTPLENNYAQATTIGQYLAKLTAKVWNEGDKFSGKRPLGNSDWKGDIIYALILSKHLDGELDEFGMIENYNEPQFNTLMNSVFDLLHNADYSSLALLPEPKEWYLVLVDIVTNVPSLVDYFSKPFTEKEAHEKLAEFKNEGAESGWIVVHIPM